MHRPSQVERTFVIASLLLYGGATLPLFGNATVGDVVNTEGDIVSQFLYLAIYIITAYYSINYTRQLKAAFMGNINLLIVFALVILSIGWSDNPLFTTRRVFALIGTSLFGYYLAIRYSLYDILHLINRSLFIAAILSALIAIALPNLGLMGAMQEGGIHEGAWKGVYIHKNALGRLMVIHTMTAFVLYSKTKQKVYWLEIGLALFLIIMSRSSSALVLVVFIICFSYVLRTSRLKGSSLIFMVLCMLTLVVFGSLYLTTNYGLLFELLGKDPTLTGRTILWEQVLTAISKRPILGHGFSGFWLGEHSASAIITQELHWANAHNGFLDVLLDLGYVGLAIFMMLYLVNLFKFMRSYSLQRQQNYEWGVMYMLLFLFYNLLESNVLRQNSLFWVLFVTTITSYSFQKIASKQTLIQRSSLAMHLNQSNQVLTTQLNTVHHLA